MALSLQGRIDCYKNLMSSDQASNQNSLPNTLHKIKYALSGFAGRSTTTHPELVRNFSNKQSDATSDASLTSRVVTLAKEVKTYIYDLVKSFLPECMLSHSLKDLLAHRRSVGDDGLKGSLPSKVAITRTNEPGLKAKGYPDRPEIDEKYISWDTPYPEYKDLVHNYTSSDVQRGPVWAHPQDVKAVDFTTFKNQSWHGFKRDGSGLPLNPLGRTGIEGRGLLGHYGPNHAADPIVLRRDEDGNLFLLSVARKDNDKKPTGQRAFPGGMVDKNENYLRTAWRELAEEALGKSDSVFTQEDHDRINGEIAKIDETLPNEEKTQKVNEIRIGVMVDKISAYDEFKNCKTVYKGVVDDPRNTDNAWMETVAVVVEFDHNSPLAQLTSLQNLEAGDDAEHAEWTPVTRELVEKMYASHGEILMKSTSVQDYLNDKEPLAASAA